jgi:hypothetical protein
MDDVPTCSLAVRFQQLLNGWLLGRVARVRLGLRLS